LYLGTVGGSPSHFGKLKLFAMNSWEEPQMTIDNNYGLNLISFNTSSVTSGYTYEFSGSVKLKNELSVNGSVTASYFIGDGSQLTNLSSQTINTGSLATTGSNTFNGNQTINGSIILDNGAIIKDNENNSISFGYLSAETNQGTQSVAIGNGAGYQNQSNGTVAIGTNAGAINQGQRAVALGSLAGTNTQGEYAVAIGNFAAPNNQAANSIVINAIGSGLENTTPNSLVIAPIRNITGSSGILQYNNTTKEVSYSDYVTASQYFGDGSELTNLPSTTNWNNGKEYVVRNTEQLTFSGDYILEDCNLLIEGSETEIEYSPNKYFYKVGSIFIGGNLLVKDSYIQNDGKISVGGEVILIGDSQIIGNGIIT
jgi:hypothetical protein